MSRPSRRASSRSRAGAFALLGFAACVLWAKPMGLLFWARIRILTNIPRTAIADDPTALAAAAPHEGTTGIGGGSSPEPAPLDVRPQPRRNPFAPVSRATPHQRNLPSGSDSAGEAKSNGDSVE